MDASLPLPATTMPPCGEAARLEALRRYAILDTPSEAEFDDITALAAQLCGTPVALISLIDTHRQWFKSRLGMPVSETPLHLSFCRHAIHDDKLLEVPDTLLDPRFHDHPVVVDAPHIRFYAGMPLRTPDGHGLGTLCVVDYQPRELSDAQREGLRRLGRQVIRLLEQRLLTHRYAEQAALQQAMFDSAASAILVLHPEGHIERANPSAEHLFGYAPDALTGRPFIATLFPPDALEHYAATLAGPAMPLVEPGFTLLTAAFDQGRPEPRTWRLRHRDGHDVPVLLSLSAIPDGQGKVHGYLAIAHDLSVQEQLQLRLQRIAAQVPGMLFQFHWRTGQPGRLTYVSEGIESIYGLQPAQTADDSGPLFTRLYSADRQSVLLSIRQAAAQLTPWRSEHRVEHPRRGLVWVEAHATPLPQPDGSVLWHGLVTDISEHKAQQAELEKQQELNRRMIETLPEAVIACDAAGQPTLFNRTAREWFGESPPRPEAWPDLCSAFAGTGGMPLPVEQLPLSRALRGEAVDNLELTLVTGDTPRHLLVSAHPLHASDGRHLGAVAVMHDITARKRAENLQREFVATVSHELRTPLTSITGSLALLCGNVLGDVPEPMRELLEIAHQNSQRLSSLINDLLDMDMLDAGQMRFELLTQPLQPLLEQALRGNQGYADRYGVFFRLTENTTATVRVDALRLHQVLSNLLSNAVKFSPPGETVELQVRTVGPRVRVSVVDHGPGLDEDFRERVFQKFAQASAEDSRRKGGTGLGLAISKELIGRMHGHIGFESRPGHGACFWIELPLSGDETS